MPLNKWIGIGRLTKSPELKITQNGVSVCSFSVAVNRPRYKGKEEETDFINIVAWRHSAEFVCKYFTKGDPIQIEGSIQVRKYQDQNGNDRTAVEVVADNVSFVEGSSKRSSGNDDVVGNDDFKGDDFTEVDVDNFEGLPWESFGE